MARTITIEIKADTTKFSRDIKQAAEEGAANMRQLKSAIDTSATALVALGVAGAAALTGIAKQAIDAAKEVDKTRQTLVALTGSVDAANKKLAELRALASSPGVTTGFAAQLFSQLKAIGGIADQAINSVIKSLGKLNAVFGDVGPDFARNLIQIFQQGFERADIKEALGKVPIFEQLLEQGFGTKDPAKLRKLKEAGTITLETFLTGISDGIDKRFPKVNEGIAAQFEKLRDRITFALAPIGEQLAKVLLPVFDDLVKAVETYGKVASDVFRDNKNDIIAATQQISAMIIEVGKLIIALGELAIQLKIPEFFGRIAAEARDVIESRGANLFTFGKGPNLTAFEQNLARIEADRKLPRLGEQPSALAGFVEMQKALADFSATRRTGAGGGRVTGTTTRAATRRRDSGIIFPSLTAAELVSSQFEGEEEFRARSATIARGRDLRRALTLQLGESEDAAFRRQRLEEGRLTRAAATFEFDQAEKARKAMEKTGELLSANARFARGFASSMETVGDAFERFGSNVARAFFNVRELFSGLKQAVFSFFNDLLGSTLQSLVRSTLGPLFGGVGGARGGAAAGGSALSLVGFGQGFGLGGSGGGGGGGFGGLGSILSGGKLNLGGLGDSLLSASPLLGLSLGAGLGGKSIGGNILGAAGGLITSTFLATTLGAPGALGSLAPALFSNPLTAIAGAGLLVGAVLLGKASQRRKDEQASGEFLTQALSGITQLRDAIAADQIDGSQARGVFDRDILGVFRQQIGTLKTASVRQSRLTNQVRDLEKDYNDVIPPQIAAQEARKAAGLADQARLQRNAITHSRLIPEFATGGTTGGGLALLHPGEKVLNLQQQASIRAMAGASVFERAGVPGVQHSRIFENGGIMPGGGGPVIVIDNLNVSMLVGKQDQTRFFVNGGNTAQGRAVVVNNINVAKTNREL